MIALAFLAAAAASSAAAQYECTIERTYVAAKLTNAWSVEELQVTGPLPNATRFILVDGGQEGSSKIVWPNSVFGINGQVQGAWSSGKFVFVADGDNCSFRSMGCVAMGELAPTSDTDAQFSIVVASKAMDSNDKQPFLFQPMAFGSCKKAGS